MGIDGLASPQLWQAGLHPGARCRKQTASGASPFAAQDSHPPPSCLQLLINFKAGIVSFYCFSHRCTGHAAVLVAMAVMHVFLGDSGEQSGHGYMVPARSQAAAQLFK